MLPMTPLVLSSGVLWPEKGVVLRGDDGSQCAMTPQGGLTTSRAYVADCVWIDALTEVIRVFNDLAWSDRREYEEVSQQGGPTYPCNWLSNLRQFLNERALRSSQKDEQSKEHDEAGNKRIDSAGSLALTK